MPTVQPLLSANRPPPPTSGDDSRFRLDVGPHSVWRSGERLVVIQYRGDVSLEHVLAIAGFIADRPKGRALAILTDSRRMGSFAPSARRHLGQAMNLRSPAEEVLLAVTGASVLGRAALAVAITATRVGTLARLQAKFIDDLSDGIEYCEDWLLRRPE